MSKINYYDRAIATAATAVDVVAATVVAVDVESLTF